MKRKRKKNCNRTEHLAKSKKKLAMFLAIQELIAICIPDGSSNNSKLCFSISQLKCVTIGL